MKHTHVIIPNKDFTTLQHLIRESYGNDQDQLFKNMQEVDLSTKNIEKNSDKLFSEVYGGWPPVSGATGSKNGYKRALSDLLTNGLMLGLLAILLLFTSCSKETLQPENKKYDYTYIADRGHDMAIFNSAYFCLEADYVKRNDTLHIILDHPIDSLKMYYEAGNIYIDEKTGLIDPSTGKYVNRFTDPIDPFKLYIRNYWDIKSFLKLTITQSP